MNRLPRNSPPSAHMSAILAQLWRWSRVVLCAVVVPCSLVFLYACFCL